MWSAHLSMPYAQQHVPSALVLSACALTQPKPPYICDVMRWYTRVLSHVMTCQAHPAPYMFYSGRDVKYPQAILQTGMGDA